MEVTEYGVMLSQEEYEGMREDIRFLRALEAAGVNNWDGYSYAQELMQEE